MFAQKNIMCLIYTTTHPCVTLNKQTRAHTRTPTHTLHTLSLTYTPPPLHSTHNTHSHTRKHTHTHTPLYIPVFVVGHAVDHVLAARAEALRVLAVHLQEHLCE